MSSKIVSNAEQTLHYCSKLNCSSKKPIPDNISTVSFSSQVSESWNSTKSISGPLGTRGPTRISALHAPQAETAETLYQVLGIAATGLITISDIKKAYKQMARKYHPDVSPPDRADEYTRRFVMVRMAYETLSNPHTRALYDGDLAAGGFGFSSSTGISHQYHQRSKGSRAEAEPMGWQAGVGPPTTDPTVRSSPGIDRSGRGRIKKRCLNLEEE